MGNTTDDVRRDGPSKLTSEQPSSKQLKEQAKEDSNP